MNYRNTIFISIVLFFLASCNTAIKPSQGDWYTIDEALAATSSKPKLMFVDMYTDWCGWCKKMDKSTFQDPTVMAYLKEHFYSVKFNAEQKAPVTFKGTEYQFEQGGRRGAHGLAKLLLEGRTAYPSFVILNEKLEVVKVLRGYRTVDQLMPELKSAARS